MNKAFSLFLALFFMTSLLGQEHANNNDLRRGVELFSIKFPKGKFSKTIALQRLSSGSHFFIEGNKDQIKVDKKNAEKIDNLFVGEFIELKYMMGGLYKKKCPKIYLLKMRQEILKVCSLDKKRFEPLQKLLKKIDTIKG